MTKFRVSLHALHVPFRASLRVPSPFAAVLRLVAALGLLVLGIGFTAGCCHRPGAVAPSAAFAHPLPALIVERLEIAREVAWAKFHSGAPVHDPAREAAILADLVAQGRERGLDPVRVEAFFTAQIAASREVQTELIAGWLAMSRKQTPPRPAHPPLDLRADIRPRLDALTPRLLDALAQTTFPAPDLAAATASMLRAAGYSPEVVALATAPLLP